MGWKSRRTMTLQGSTSGKQGKHRDVLVPFSFFYQASATSLQSEGMLSSLCLSAAPCGHSFVPLFDRDPSALPGKGDVSAGHPSLQLLPRHPTPKCSNTKVTLCRAKGTASQVSPYTAGFGSGHWQSKHTRRTDVAPMVPRREESVWEDSFAEVILPEKFVSDRKHTDQPNFPS